ncbi:MAG: SecY-interacting protein Syd [Pontibacterium sp.]
MPFFGKKPQYTPNTAGVIPDAANPLTTEALEDLLIPLQTQAGLTADYSSDWPSPCVISHSEQKCQWQPVYQLEQGSYAKAMFTRLEEALGFTVHPDLVAFYSLFWSHQVETQLPESLAEHLNDNGLCLLLPWSEQDLEALRQNYIGHYLQQKKRKLAPTFFFACPLNDEKHMISLNNQTGEVVLERPGYKPSTKLADNLGLFLKDLRLRSAD